MDGFTLYKEIKRKDERLKICFITASEEYYEQHRKDEFSKLDKDMFIQKPIEMEKLVKRINKILDN